MEIEFHGVRGSIPIPSENFLEYGGNTTCIEISSKDFQLIIDAGSGFKNVKISDEKPTFLIFSHFHHDHLQGLPFNEALFSTKNQIHVGSGLVGKEGLEEAMAKGQAGTWAQCLAHCVPVPKAPQNMSKT